jgi:hypothetical protein
MKIFKNGAPAGEAYGVDFREGDGVVLTVADEPANGTTSVTVASGGLLTAVKQTLSGFFNRWTPTGSNAIAARTPISKPAQTNGYWFAQSGSNVWRTLGTGTALSTSTTWVACSLPASVSSGTKILDAVYYKGYIVIQGVEDSGTGNMAVWVSNSTLTGAGTLTWTKVLDGTALSQAYRGTLCVVRDGAGNTGNDVALLAGEYGDSLTVKLWRTTIVPTGTPDWTVPSPFPLVPATMRHIHSVAADTWSGAPAGQVWLTAGDGVVNTILRSTDSGATFTVDQASSNWQAVQIDFTPSYVWFFSDSQKHFPHVRRRSDGAYMWACPNDYRHTYIEPDRYADGVIAADGTTVTSVALSQEHVNGLAVQRARQRPRDPVRRDAAVDSRNDDLVGQRCDRRSHPVGRHAVWRVEQDARCVQHPWPSPQVEAERVLRGRVRRRDDRQGRLRLRRRQRPGRRRPLRPLLAPRSRCPRRSGRQPVGQRWCLRTRLHRQRLRLLRHLHSRAADARSGLDPYLSVPFS